MGGWQYEPQYGSRYERPREVHHHHYNDRGRGYNQNSGYRQEVHHHHSSSASDIDIVPIIVIVVVAITICFAIVQYREAQRQKRITEAITQVEVLKEAPYSAIETGGKPVFFSGPCTVDGPVADAKFGLVTQGHPIMWRKVEVFQWRETASQVEERRGDQVRRGTKYSYKAEWSSSFVSSDGFKDPKYR